MHDKHLAIALSAVIGACVAAVLMFSGTSHAYAEPGPIANRAGVVQGLDTVTSSPPTSVDISAPGKAPGEADNEPDADNPNNVTRNVIIAIIAGAILAGGIVVYVKHGDNID